MMLLGLVLHAGMSYLVVPFPVWPVYDPQRSVAFDLMILWIHVFRMPVFFVVAGFFANLVWEKRGRGGFVRNRGQRVGLVFAVVLIPLYAATFTAMEYGLHRFDADPWGAVGAAFLGAELMNRFALMHLWFLYYLLLFYAVVVGLKAWGPARLDGVAARACAWMLGQSWAASFLMGLATAGALTTMPKGVLMTAQRFWPLDGRVIAAYLLFFGFGWYIYPNRERLPWLIRGHRAQLAVGTALVFATLPWLKQGLARPVAAVMGPATWLLIFGFLGLFQRWLDKPSSRVRYLSDASYWLYLTHIPVLVFGVAVLMPLPWPATAKFTVVLAVGTPLLVTTYHLFVRNTWIGVLLNGKRADEGSVGRARLAADAAAGT